MPISSPEYKTLSIDLIVTDPDQPRKKGFDDESMASMVSVVKEQGVLQDIVVSQGDDGKYMIVFGERRYRAALAAGIEELHVKIDNLSGAERLKAQLTENIQRADLDVRDRAAALARFVALSPDQKTAAKSLALSEARISQLLELTQLSPELEEMVSKNIVRDTSTLIMANQLIKRAPAVAAVMLKEASENGKLSRAKVIEAMAPYTKRRTKAEIAGDNNDTPVATPQHIESGSPPSIVAVVTDSVHPQQRISVASPDHQGTLLGFEKVSSGKVARVKKMLAIDWDIPTDELVAMLVDAYLASEPVVSKSLIHNNQITG
jgi:ParB family chromosome partitioning protein